MWIKTKNGLINAAQVTAFFVEDWSLYASVGSKQFEMCQHDADVALHIVEEHLQYPDSWRNDVVCDLQCALEKQKLYVQCALEKQKLSQTQPIGELGFSGNTTNALKRAGYDTIGALQLATDEELLCIRGFGVKALQEVREAIAKKREED